MRWKRSNEVHNGSLIRKTPIIFFSLLLHFLLFHAFQFHANEQLPTLPPAVQGYLFFYFFCTVLSRRGSGTGEVSKTLSDGLPKKMSTHLRRLCSSVRSPIVRKHTWTHICGIKVSSGCSIFVHNFKHSNNGYWGGVGELRSLGAWSRKDEKSSRLRDNERPAAAIIRFY